MIEGIGDEEIVRHVVDRLVERESQVSRAELERIVREEFAVLCGRPVHTYLSILTERAARRRLKKVSSPSG